MSIIDPTLVGPGGDVAEIVPDAAKELGAMMAAQANVSNEVPKPDAGVETLAKLEAPRPALPVQVQAPVLHVGISAPSGISLPQGISMGGGIAAPPGVLTLGGSALPQGSTAKDELRADVLWGPSGSGKSVQVGWAAYMVAKVLKKKSLIVTADGGAVSAEVKALQELGFVDILPLLRFENPLSILDNVFQGFWPIRKSDGSWSMADRAANHQNDNAWYQQYGAMFVESMTSLGDFLMPWLTGNPKANIPGGAKDHQVVDGDKIYKFAGMAHYGFLGDRFYQWVHWSAAQRYEKILWTAREQRSTTDKGMVVIGPDAPGKAITQKSGGWFGGCYHMSVMATGEMIVDTRADVAKDSLLLAGKGASRNEHRMYIVKHPDPETGIMCDVKNRLSVDRVMKLEKPYVVCQQDKDGLGGSGIATIWGWEQETQGNLAKTMKDELQDAMKALKMIPDVTEV